RKLLRGEWLRAELFGRAPRGTLADAPRLQFGEAATRLAVITDLPVAVLGRDGRGHRPAVGLAERSPHTARRHDHRRGLGVAVRRLAELRHPGVGGARRLLYGERDRAPVAERAVDDASLVDVE